MRNKILENVIDDVIDNSSEKKQFKSAMKKYIKNKFDGNVGEEDLKNVLALIKERSDC